MSKYSIMGTKDALSCFDASILPTEIKEDHVLVPVELVYLNVVGEQLLQLCNFMVCVVQTKGD